MSPQTRNSIKTSPKVDGTQSLSQLERRGALERGKRVCIVCGTLARISESVVYPKSKQRRLEFNNSLKLPLHVSEALPVGCFICGDHFKPSDVEISTGIGHVQVSDFAVPCLNLDHEFLNTLRALDEDELEPRSAIRMVKTKLEWDFNHSTLMEQENGYDSEESRNSNEDSNNVLVSTLFGNPEFSKPLTRSRKRESLPPQIQPPLKAIRLVPVHNKHLEHPPPVLEKMENNIEDSNDQPPALSPVFQQSQRTKSLKDLPQLEVSNLTPTTSIFKLRNDRVDDKDLTIQRLRHSLKQKTTELDLLRKKLKITEELLQFYQDNSNGDRDQAPDLLPRLSECRNSISDNESDQDDGSPQATAVLVEGNQLGLQQHLEKLLKKE